MLITRFGGAIGLTAIIARPVFGYPLVGQSAGSSILDMAPFENEEPRVVSTGDEEVVAGLSGMICGLLGEFTQRIFYAHSGTHVDPPAMAITIQMLAIAVLSIAGVLPNSGYLAF